MISKLLTKKYKTITYLNLKELDSTFISLGESDSQTLRLYIKPFLKFNATNWMIALIPNLEEFKIKA